MVPCAIQQDPCCSSVLRTHVKVYVCRPQPPTATSPGLHPAGSRKSVLCVCSCFRREAPLCHLDSAYKWCRMVFVFLCLTSLGVTISRSIQLLHVASFRSFLRLSSVPLCVYTASSLSSHLSVDV